MTSRHSDGSRRRMRVVLAAWMSVALASCTSFDPLDQRGETVNRTAADYANNATLLNVVRASLSEPLTFVTITGLDGTDTASTSLGLPSIPLGPHMSGAVRNYTFGPNSVARGNQNTFHVSIVDDPQSFTALLAPLNPAMVGFFIRQGYPRELLFFLFTDRLQEVDVDPSGNVVGVKKEWANDPKDGPAYLGFVGEMAGLLLGGLTAEVDVTTVPSGRSLPLSRLCIDSSVRRPAFRSEPSKFERAGDSCADTAWLQTQGATTASSGSSGSSGGGGANAVAVTGNDLWVTLGNQSKVVRVTAGPTGQLVVSQPAILPTTSDKPPKLGPLVAYPLTYPYQRLDPNGVVVASGVKHYRLFMRSTYGVYNYVGAVLHHHNDVTNLLNPDESGYGGMLKILEGQEKVQAGSPGCFAEAEHRTLHYCVPNASDRTKQVFALLHQLQQLNTAPSNAPTTLNVVPPITP